MNSIEKLNNLIKSIEASKKARRRESTAVDFNYIDFSDLNIELIVGSKVNIQSSEAKNIETLPSIKDILGKEVLLENYLKAISKYRKYQNKSPRYKLETNDLSLDVNLELKQKYLVTTPRKIKKTPADIKKDISITLLENLKTSVFLYKNLDKERNYKASFDDLTLDIEIEYNKKSIKKGTITELIKPEVNKFSDTLKGLVPIDNIIGDKENKVNILKEKLMNIEKFKQSNPIRKHKTTSNNIELGVTVTKSGKQIISLNRENKINKLKQLLESISSYKEHRDGLH